jgi:hypothetical protein
MDPTACWFRLLSAVSTNDPEEAYYAAEDLRQWVRKGGPYPTGWNHELVLGMISWVQNRWPDRYSPERESLKDFEL